MPPTDVLTTAPRCVLAHRGSRWPVATPTAFWSDGAALWAVAPVAARDPLRLDPACAVYVPPPDGGEGLRLEGRARVYGSHDPMGLLLHGPTVSAAVTALSLKHAGAAAGFARDLARLPIARLTAGRVVLKVTVEHTQRSRAPAEGDGIAPPLPQVVPPDVRRAVGGRRDVVLAVQDGDDLTIGPARLGAGFAVATDMAWRPRPGAAAIVVEAGPPWRPSELTGLRLAGDLGADGHLVAREATWWHGGGEGSAEVPARPTGIVLPD